MADVFSPLKRSKVMSAIRSKGNKDTELKLIEILRRQKINGWRRHRRLPGRPDFVFGRVRLAVFVDGCFWHGCPKHGRKPATNKGYWGPKFIRNRTRDREATRLLRKAGWRVLRLWEHELASEVRTATRLRKAIQASLR